MTQLKRLEIHHLLWLALGLALLGSLRHLAHIFGSVDGNWFAGWLQAIAVDAGLFALAYSLKARETRRRVVWLGIAMFTGISIYGNLAYGMLKMNEGGVLPAWIIWSKPYISSYFLLALFVFFAIVQWTHRDSKNEWSQINRELLEANRLKDIELKHAQQLQKAQADYINSLEVYRGKIEAELDTTKTENERLILEAQIEEIQDIIDGMSIGTSPGFIYVMRRQDGIIKLGRTNNTDRRRKAHENDYGQSFDLIKRFVVPDTMQFEKLALSMTNQYEYPEDNRLELRSMTDGQLTSFISDFRKICAEGVDA